MILIEDRKLRPNEVEANKDEEKTTKLKEAINSIYVAIFRFLNKRKMRPVTTNITVNESPIILIISKIIFLTLIHYTKFFKKLHTFHKSLVI